MRRERLQVAPDSVERPVEFLISVEPGAPPPDRLDLYEEPALACPRLP